MPAVLDPAKDKSKDNRLDDKGENPIEPEQSNPVAADEEDEGYVFRPRVKKYTVARKFCVADRVYITSGSRGLQGPYLVSSVPEGGGGYILSTLDSSAYVEERRVFREDELDFAN